MHSAVLFPGDRPVREALSLSLGTNMSQLRENVKPENPLLWIITAMPNPLDWRCSPPPQKTSRELGSIAWRADHDWSGLSFDWRGTRMDFGAVMSRQQAARPEFGEEPGRERPAGCLFAGILVGLLGGAALAAVA